MASEAKRNKFPFRYDIIPPHALRRIAKRFEDGMVYEDDQRGRGGNWRKGLPGDKHPINHALAHITNWQKESLEIEHGTRTERSDDDLAAACLNLMMIMDWEGLGIVDPISGKTYMDKAEEKFAQMAADRAAAEVEPAPAPVTPTKVDAFSKIASFAETLKKSVVG